MIVDSNILKTGSDVEPVRPPGHGSSALNCLNQSNNRTIEDVGSWFNRFGWFGF